MINQTTNSFSIPYLSNDTLKEKARYFISLYNPSKIIPVPIEHIAEYDLGISIIPTKDLERTWGIDAFINSQLDTIIIDDHTYTSQEERSRFSIAHEMAHKILHTEVYQKLAIEDEESFLHFQDNGNLTQKKRMEYQAYFFAGYIVLPEDTFNNEFKKLYDSLASVDIDELQQIARILCDKFHVSGDCLEKQLRREFPSIITQITAYR